jgi:hypothetical protein
MDFTLTDCGYNPGLSERDPWNLGLASRAPASDRVLRPADTDYAPRFAGDFDSLASLHRVLLLDGYRLDRSGLAVL